MISLIVFTDKTLTNKHNTLTGMIDEKKPPRKLNSTKMNQETMRASIQAFTLLKTEKREQ